MTESFENTSAIAPSVIKAGPYQFGQGCVIHESVIVGFANLYPDIFENDDQRVVRIGDRCVVYPWTLIYEGATLDTKVHVEERCTIGSLTHIGSESRLFYGAQVHDNVMIGEKCVVGGFIADNCSVGDGSSVFGSLVHLYDHPGVGNWDTTDEMGPEIGDEVIIGWGAVVVGPVRIGDGARIAPNSVVRADLPSGCRYGF